MFRAAIVPIVLTLIVGPNTALLCSVWCFREATTSACQHEDATTSPNVTGQNSCCAVPPNAAAVVPEGARAGSPANDAQHTVVVRAFRFASPLIDIGQADRVSKSASAAGPPLLITLRI